MVNFNIYLDINLDMPFNCYAITELEGILDLSDGGLARALTEFGHRTDTSTVQRWRTGSRVPSVNSIDWLSDETGLSELRTKIITGYPIKEDIDEKKKSFIKYANTMFPIILLIIFGVLRFRIQNRKRKNWMENKI